MTNLGIISTRSGVDKALCSALVVVDDASRNAVKELTLAFYAPWSGGTTRGEALMKARNLLMDAVGAIDAAMGTDSVSNSQEADA